MKCNIDFLNQSIPLSSS